MKCTVHVRQTQQLPALRFKYDPNHSITTELHTSLPLPADEHIFNCVVIFLILAALMYWSGDSERYTRYLPACVGALHNRRWWKGMVALAMWRLEKIGLINTTRRRLLTWMHVSTHSIRMGKETKSLLKILIYWRSTCTGMSNSESDITQPRNACAGTVLAATLYTCNVEWKCKKTREWTQQY